MNLDVAAAILGHSRLGMRRYDAGARHAPDWFCAGAAERRLAAALAEADLHCRLVELEAWRDYHGATVRSASSLALALFAQQGLDLDAAVRQLGPNGSDPAWLVGAAFARRARKARPLGRKDSRNLHAEDERERFLHSGHVIRRPRDPCGALGISLSRHGLEVAFGFPEVTVRTRGDEAIIALARAVPEAVRLAMVGRPVGDLIDHPVLRDPALVVTDVVDARDRGPDALGAWTMVARAPRVPWLLPWARGGG